MLSLAALVVRFVAIFAEIDSRVAAAAAAEHAFPSAIHVGDAAAFRPYHFRAILHRRRGNGIVVMSGCAMPAEFHSKSEERRLE